MAKQNVTKDELNEPDLENDPSDKDTEDGDACEEKEDQQEDDENLQEEAYEIIQRELEAYRDSRAIWATQRFFIFSLVFTVLKIFAWTLSPYFSIRAIAIDAVLDLIISGLSIYLIQWQQKTFAKVHNGTQEIKVNEAGALAIATIQGLIILIGGIVIVVQGSIEASNQLAYRDYLTPLNQGGFQILPGLILAVIFGSKLWMHYSLKEDADMTDNIAIKSLATNLFVDMVVNISAWFILVATSFWYWPVILFDSIIGILIGIWMIVNGLKFMKPLFLILIEAFKEQEWMEEEQYAGDIVQDDRENKNGNEASPDSEEPKEAEKIR